MEYSKLIALFGVDGDQGSLYDNFEFDEVKSAGTVHQGKLILPNLISDQSLGLKTY